MKGKYLDKEGLSELIHLIKDADKNLLGKLNTYIESNNSQMADINKAIESVVLWDVEPLNGDLLSDECKGDEITLSESSEHFECLEIFGITDDKYKVSVKVESPNNSSFNLQNNIIGWSSYIAKCKTYKIVGDTISVMYRSTSNKDNPYSGNVIIPIGDAPSVTRVTRDVNIFGIYKVIGYRKRPLTHYTMTLREKICQMFIVRPEQLCTDLSSTQQHISQVKGVTSGMLEGLRNNPVGGIIISANNIDTEQQIRQFISDYKDADGRLPFISVDEEGGRVARVANSISSLLTFESAYDIGLSGNVENAETMGSIIGGYLTDLGFNLDFAPVADVWSNPDNTVIGNRSFGTTPQLVSDMVGGFLHGMHESPIATTLKHFPGHGDTSLDTHTGDVVVTKTWSELLRCEIIPFADNMDNTDFVMVSHIIMSGIDDSGLPSSLSERIVTDKLINTLGYNGLIITDGFEMNSVKNRFTSAEAAVQAIKAGCDMICGPYNLEEAIDGVLDAVEQGVISQDRIDRSVMKIIAKKKELYGIHY